MALLDNKLTADKQAALDAILAKIPASDYVGLDLPSRGKFYPSTVPIEIRPLGWEDEKALLSRKGDDNAVSILINSVLRGVTCESLIPIDKNYILFKLREITVGPEYEIKITCPHCTKVGEVNIDTSDFNVTHLEEDCEDPREVTLPMSKLVISVRFQRGHEEREFSDGSKYLDNLWRLVTEIDGQSDSAIIAQVIKKLSSPDLQAIRSAISMDDYGLDTKFMYKCAECDMETLLEAPIGPDFFLKS